MKSQVKRPEIDHLIFQWEHKAPKSSGSKRNANTEYNNHRLLDEYFDLLAEIKPHKQEPSVTKMFGVPFTLPHLKIRECMKRRYTQTNQVCKNIEKGFEDSRIQGIEGSSVIKITGYSKRSGVRYQQSGFM